MNHVRNCQRNEIFLARRKRALGKYVAVVTHELVPQLSVHFSQLALAKCLKIFVFVVRHFFSFS